MAILLNGIFGALSGTIGNLVFRNLRGVTVVSRRPIRRNKNLTRTQLERQAKFSKICGLLKPLVPLLKRTYRLRPQEMSSFNKAFSDNIRNVISGIYPAYQIDWTALLLSRGNLPAIPAELVAGQDKGTLEFRWAFGSDPARDAGRAWVAAYCEALNGWEFKMNGATRKGGQYALNVKAFWGCSVKAYSGFISADGKLITHSSYTGSITLIRAY